MKSVIYCSYKAGDLSLRFRLTLTSAVESPVIVEEAFTDAHGEIGWLISARMPGALLTFSYLILSRLASGELSIPGASKDAKTGVVTADLGTYTAPNMG